MLNEFYAGSMTVMSFYLEYTQLSFWPTWADEQTILALITTQIQDMLTENFI
jgi:hypothetical protein